MYFLNQELLSFDNCNFCTTFVDLLNCLHYIKFRYVLIQAHDATTIKGLLLIEKKDKIKEICTHNMPELGNIFNHARITRDGKEKLFQHNIHFVN